MKQPRHLFVVADDEHEHPAVLARAAALATALSARIHVGMFGYSRAIAAVGLLSPDAMATARDGYVERLRGDAARRAAALADHGLEVTWSAVWAHPALPEVLLQLAEQQADLVIEDVHRDPLFQRLTSTALDQLLLRHCPVPVMLVGEQDRPLPRRILVAIDVIDGDDVLNAELLHYAAGLALLCDAELHLVYVSEPLQLMDNELLVTGATNQDLEAEVHRSRAEALVRFAGQEQIPAPQCTFLQGAPAATICSLAVSQDVDLIVLGDVSHSRFDRWLLGSTTEQVVQHAHCSVLWRPAQASHALLR